MFHMILLLALSHFISTYFYLIFYWNFWTLSFISNFYFVLKSLTGQNKLKYLFQFLNQFPHKKFLYKNNYFRLSFFIHAWSLSYYCFLFYFKFGSFSFDYYPFVMHGFLVSLFSSLIGPFGGFLASGLKRACRQKVSETKAIETGIILTADCGKKVED